MEQVPVRIEWWEREQHDGVRIPIRTTFFIHTTSQLFHVGELADADFEQPCGQVCVCLYEPNMDSE